MALHLNLYYEIHRQLQRERRDPFKLAMLGCVVLILLLVLWYFYRQSAVGHVIARRNALQAEWTKLEPQMKAAVEGEPAALARQKSNQALVERVQQRFFWGPFLETIGEITPAHIQLAQMACSIDVDKEKGKKTFNVLIRGVAAGAQPRTTAEDYRGTLQEKLSKIYGDTDAIFDANSLEDGSDTVQLDGQTLATATFRIRLQFSPPKAAAQPSPDPSKPK